MPRLKIRVELNKGGIGISLSKLVAIADQTQRFLDMVAQDIGIESPQWVAKEFDNNSVDFNCECLVGDEYLERRGSGALTVVAEGRRDDAEFANVIRPSTWRQFAEIVRPIDPDEVIGFGIYNGTDVAKFIQISKERYIQESERRPQFIKYYGQIQGIIHSFLKESNHPKLVIRELATKELVNCFFDAGNPDMYDSAIRMLKNPDMVLFVEGEVEENRDTGVVVSVRVKDFSPAPKFNLAEFKKGVGAFPGLTGELATEAFVDKIRQHGEAP